MSLTLNDLLTPEQITAAESALQGEIEQLTTAEFEAIATIQAQFNQARAEARRRVLLAQLVPVTPAPVQEGTTEEAQDTTEETPEEIAQPEQGAPEVEPVAPEIEQETLQTDKTAGLLSPTEAYALSGVPRGSWNRYLKSGDIAPAATGRGMTGKPTNYYRREDVVALGELHASRAERVETVRGLPVLDRVPKGCLTSAQVMERLGVSKSTLTRYRADSTVETVGVLRDATKGSMHWEMVLRINDKTAPAAAPSPKEVYPETTYTEHLEMAKEVVRKAMEVPAPFGLIFHSTRQEWATAVLGRLEPGWGFVLRLERFGLEWVPAIPISCRSHWTGKVAEGVLADLRERRVIKP